MRRPLALLFVLALVPLAFAAQPKKRPEDPAAGKEHWDRSCWQCHGKLNDGQGPAASALLGGVPDLRGTITPESYDALVPVILEGKGLMPAFDAEINNHDAKRILIYLTKLDTDGPPKEDDAKGEADDESPKDVVEPPNPKPALSDPLMAPEVFPIPNPAGP